MNVQEILDRKIAELPAGPYLDGLRAVKLHIASAVRHFLRGQSELDETLFTDVIFRCNQAFEGSIKEAYRVLAGKDPANKSPAEIEKFIASGNLLRKKVLDQFTRYRQEWRNPSTHDYTLDFDENEALLAVVTVTVFAIVLCDQIESKIAFEDARSSPSSGSTPEEEQALLLDLVSWKARSFAMTHEDEHGTSRSMLHDYYRLEGALAGFLTAELGEIPGVTIVQNAQFNGGLEADVLVQRGNEIVVVELKRTSAPTRAGFVVQRAIAQAALYLRQPSVVGAVAVIYTPSAIRYSIGQAPEPLSERVRIVAPDQSDIEPEDK